MAGEGHLFTVCWKAVELRSSVDPLSGAIESDPRSLGVSPADEAALELALRCAERFRGTVRVVSAGDERCLEVLGRAAAAGAGELVHLVCEPSWPSEWVAGALASVAEGSSLVWCGDASADRGSGAVPAFLAAELSMGQVLGAVAVELGEAPGPLQFEVLRRLDGGRRERFSAGAGTVVSVEGHTASLRRAGLRAVLGACSVPVASRTAMGPFGQQSPDRVLSVGPFRPRATVVPPPDSPSAIGRIKQLTGLGGETDAGGAGAGAGARSGRAVPLYLDEQAAAVAVLDTLRSWGELGDA